MLFALGLLAGAIAIPGIPSPHVDLSAFGPWVYAVPILIATKALLELLRPVFRAALKTHVKYEADIFAHFQIVSYIVWGTSIALVFYVLLGFGGSGQFTFLGTTFVAAALLYIMQEPLLNLVGWVVLVSMGLYKLGDRIEMNNSKGYVVEITPMNTTIREFGGALYGDSFTGRYVTIPHSQILKGNVCNYTKDTPFVWDQLIMNVTYESDLKLAERLIYEAAEEVVGPMMRENRAHLRSKYEFADLADYVAEEPRVGWSLGASSIDLTLVYFCPVFAKGERHVPHAPRETDPRVVHGRAQGAVRIPARPVRAVVRGPGEGSGGAREGSGERTGERKAVRHAMIANGPPDSLREFVLLRDSMAGPFRSLTSIGPADHGKEVSLAGWAEDVRNLGGIAFLIVRQRAGTFQIRESVVAARGTVQPNRQVRNGWELLATTVDVLSPAAAPLPLPVADKVGADMDTRFDNRTLDLRKPERRAIFHIRSLVESAVRGYLEGQAFVEVHTPKLAGAGAEGGATLFQTDYFGRRAYLSQSPQLYKQMLMSTGLDRVFEIAPAFRAEPSDTVRHVTEFTSFDGEVAWIERQEDVFAFLEGAVDQAIERVQVDAKTELELLQASPTRPKVPFKRLAYGEALEILRGEGKRVRDGDDIDTEGEKLLGLSMAKEDHPIYFLTQREHRYDQLVQRIKEKGLNVENFEFYLKAFRYGMPPHGGWGFGLDRFVQKLLDLPNIREAILFPRDRTRLIP